MFKPEDDGRTHINVYSKGKTIVGRLLSNFAYTPFRIPFWGSFHSVEGFWYWMITGDERLRKASGYEAKRLGTTLPALRDHPTKRELRIAYRAKLRYNPEVRRKLRSSSLPLLHYYVYEGKVVSARKWAWTAELWNEFRV